MTVGSWHALDGGEEERSASHGLYMTASDDKSELKMSGSIRKLPRGSYALMVHRQYVDRTRDSLLGIEPLWTVVERTKCTENLEHDTQENSQDAASEMDDRCQMLDSQVVHGPGKDRRGYILILVRGIASPRRVLGLHPMARQNIPWCSPITHQIAGDNIRVSLGATLLEALISEAGFHLDRDALRVDTFPREKSEQTCLSIQEAAFAMTGVGRDFGCYEGPVTMTKSNSRCSHRLTVIFGAREGQQSVTMWGVSVRSSKDVNCLHVALNCEANDEIKLFPTDPQTGVDLPTSRPMPKEAPVSRAYFKLKQVWDDLSNREPELCKQLAAGVGLDLGSAPGGWTQVLCHCVGMQQVISIDGGVLAKRVDQLPQVTHIQRDLASMDAALDIARIVHEDRQLSVLVCDASIVAYELLDKVTVLIQQLPRKHMFGTPCVLIFTLKFPHKRKNSIRQQIRRAREAVPRQLSHIASVMYDESQPIQVRYQVLHLMANSLSERTFLVVFENDLTR